MALDLALASLILSPNPNPPNVPSFPLPLKTPIITCSATKNKQMVRRDPSLDNQASKQNRLRFVQKLKTLILSKPRRFIPLSLLHRCRSYLSLPSPRPLLPIIHRYPSLFDLFHLPNHFSDSTLCVRLTPAAAALAARESILRDRLSDSLASKLQKLLMLSPPHHRLLLSKLVHLAPDLGLPPDFRSRLCNSHPDRFRTVDTSYGRALELVSFDPSLAVPIPVKQPRRLSGLIVDRPLKFKHLSLRRGVNLKRKHREFLIRFGDFPEAPVYSTEEGLEGLSAEMEEKRACGVVREVLGMTVERRTLVDHLTHFRKEFRLPNRLRGMLVRHPDMFYVSIKGQRDSVFLVEDYDDNGVLLVRDELLELKEGLVELVREGKRMRRERRQRAAAGDLGFGGGGSESDSEDENEEDGFVGE
ncbi:hypothetical protein QJS04_geneDACA012435 [Acorus gramineus]|uniref:PORR domain-containing protein n=1 Tax=Acorus gramineus TaxID=55184 RepID=A0AAV9BB29_ACOGR|nr:hypothetical protein QJS04_geneDACA012435 [Acorus gramineus]